MRTGRGRTAAGDRLGVYEGILGILSLLAGWWTNLLRNTGIPWYHKAGARAVSEGSRCGGETSQEQHLYHGPILEKDMKYAELFLLLE